LSSSVSENIDKNEIKDSNVNKERQTFKYYKIVGMTCSRCEGTIEESVHTLTDVVHCDADYVKGLLKIAVSRDDMDSETILNRIRESGYEGREISRSSKLLFEIYPLLIAVFAFSILFLVGKRMSLLNRIPEIREEMSYPLLFVIGLITSLHCIGMCGGINLSQTGNLSDEISRFPTIRRSVRYNIGRMISYTILGGIVGGIGSVISLSLSLQSIIVITAGLVMIIMGLNMIGLMSSLKFLVPVLPGFLAGRIKSFSQKRNPLGIGLLNGFMPCGPLQSMQLYALSTGSVLSGAFSMFLFSAGTVPLMFLFGTIGIFFSKRFQKTIMKISALLIAVLGMGMVSRGLSLNGVLIHPQGVDKIAVDAAIARIEGDFQTVRSDVSPYGYEPIIVQAGIPVRWILEAGAGDITGCNNAIISREFGIRQGLSEGETVVDFTPEESGNFGFTCWMGMINSNILVVDDVSSFDPELLNSPTASSSVAIELIVPDFSAHDIDYAEISDGIQKSTLTIDQNGLEHSILVMQKDLKTLWKIETGRIDERGRTFVFPAFDAQLELSADTVQSIELSPAGDFYFYSWKGDFLGFVIAVDEIENVSHEEVLEKVKSYINK
jgi:sulfite exporter TauE/SafE/plastocyanin domain-containing protein/copper chaperone CopZ